jgi:hypothetical protein
LRQQQEQGQGQEQRVQQVLRRVWQWQQCRLLLQRLRQQWQLVVIMCL